jgi:hypothetical protein
VPTEAVFTAAGSAPAGSTEAVPTEAVFTAAGSAPAVLAEAGPTEAETWPAKARSAKESSTGHCCSPLTVRRPVN